MTTGNSDHKRNNDASTMAEPTIECNPNEINRSVDSPARKRQRRAYQTIMEKPKFNEVCNLVHILYFFTAPQLSLCLLQLHSYLL